MARIVGGDVARLRALARVQPLRPEEAYWLVGFLEAEAHFYVRPNNGGANWQCGMRVGLRDDDADVLLELAHRTALGRVRPVPARRTSLPQAFWAVDSRLETERLAAVLRQFPPVGRCRHEVREWIAAIDVLGQRPRGTSETGWHALARHAAEMQRMRKFARRYDPSAGLEMPDPLFLAWLGGFFTGEGSISLQRTQARLSVHLRRDDRPLLEALQSRLQMGRIYDNRAYGTSAPASAWVVCSRADLRRLVEVLEQAGLRGRKGRQFAVWEAAVRALGGPPSRFAAAREAFTEASKYVPPATIPYTSRALARARDAYVDVLRTFAAETAGPLTCTGYSVARRAHSEWPTRGTIMLTFGSWAEALDAAGLRHRAHTRSAA